MEPSPLSPAQPPRPPLLKRIGAERVALIAILALYMASVFGFAVATPYGENPDEHAHFAYIEHLVVYGTLPAIKKDPYTYESIQPPLYYMIGSSVAILGRALTGKKREAVLAPPVQNDPTHEEIVRPSVMLHPPETRWPFWVYAMRALSALMGAGVILLTYATARAIIDDGRRTTDDGSEGSTENPQSAIRNPKSVVPLLAAAICALIPQANAIRASVSNENMADLAGALLIWLLTLHLTRPYSAQRVVWIGIALGVGALSKLMLIPFILPAVWVLWLRRHRHHERETAEPQTISNSKLETQNSKLLWRDLLLMLAPLMLVAGWLYIYKWFAYGDPLADTAAHIMLSHRSNFRLEQFFWFDYPFREFLWESFWGNYGWQQVWLPDWQYGFFSLFTIAAIVGGITLLFRRTLTWAQQRVCLMMLMCLILTYAAVVYVSTDQIIWQGREMYPALSGVCVLMALGLAGLLLGRRAVAGTELTSAGVGVETQIRAKRAYRLYFNALAGPALVVITSLGLLALNLFSILWLVLPAFNP